MAKMNEYDGKKLLEKSGILIPRGKIAFTAEQAYSITENLGGNVVIKALVETTSRFKKGLICFANSPEQAEKIAKHLLSKEINGLKIKKLLIEEKLNIEKEFYIGIIVDDSYKIKSPVLMFSADGGIDFEQVSEEKVLNMKINIVDGLNIKNVEKSISNLDVPANLIKPLAKIAEQLYLVFRKYDCRSAEINPVIVTKDGKIFAGDCKIDTDEAAKFRHPELDTKNSRDTSKNLSELELIAYKMEENDYRGTGYFTQIIENSELKQKHAEDIIGFHAIGGGAVILGMKSLNDYGLIPANIADTSGNPPASKIYRVIKLIFSQNIDGYMLIGAVFANQDQRYHALALVKALREELKDKPNFPVIILIAGNKEKETIEILNHELKELPAKIEIYGRDYIYQLDYLAERMKILVKEYKKTKNEAK
jgi:succinyl-CoA synthetase beta subunit